MVANEPTEAPPAVNGALDILLKGLLEAEAERAEVYVKTEEDYERGQEAAKRRRIVNETVMQIADGYDKLVGSPTAGGILQKARKQAADRAKEGGR